MDLFQATIDGWDSWGKVYQSIEDFKPLISYIWNSHNLPYSEVTHCTPGTNAVFQVGSYIVKLFAPKESGMNTESDYKTELFGIKRAYELGVSAPKLLASGTVKDKYVFHYLVMEYISGRSLGELEGDMTDDEKKKCASQLREITDKMHTPCECFNEYDVIDRAQHCERWNEFPISFQRERTQYLSNNTKKLYNTAKVYVHGDLNPDNILVDSSGQIYVIDFADAMLAPVEYELAALVCELFCFEKPYMDGYFGTYEVETLTEQCFEGLLLHEFGYNIIRSNFGGIEQITSLAVLKERLRTALSKQNK